MSETSSLAHKYRTLVIRGAFCLLLFFALVPIPLASAQRQSDVRSENQNPTGFVCYGCPSNGWRPGPDMPSTAVRTVGVFLPNDNFYVLGGRCMDGVGNDFIHPFEFNLGTNTWSIKSATYPDNQVSNFDGSVIT